MSAALRYNTGKPDISQIDKFGSALDKLASVMSQGAIKYEDDNWLLGDKPVEEYLQSARRHHRAFVNGEVYDSDSGNHHLAHAAWNYLAALRLLFDDAPVLDPDFDQEAFIARWTEPQDPNDEVADELPAIRVTYEGQLADMRVSTPDIGSNTIHYDGGGKITLTVEQCERAEEMGMLVYLDS